ncbi:MAG: hypothetical protein MJZ47_02425 [Bacteroidales bacterium]|nr:hypothetical protein [Bacteroidales bacterium]
MKTRLIVVLLAAATLLCSCRKLCDGCHNPNCNETVKPADLKPINWDGWNDTYTIWYNCHRERTYDDADVRSWAGDTIRCYGRISKYLYDDYTSFSEVQNIYLECTSANKLEIDISMVMSGSGGDSLVRVLDSSSYSDTCFVKGLMCAYGGDIMGCYYLTPSIMLTSAKDIYFKNNQP